MRKFSTLGPAVLVLLTAVVVLIAGPATIRELTFAQTSARVFQASERLNHDNVLEQVNQAYRDIATLMEPSVVHISARRPMPELRGFRTSSTSTGSGWVYDEEGHIVTNYHVIEGADAIEVQLYTGEIRPAEIIGSDPLTDIAVLKIPSGRLHAAPLADVRDPVVRGDMVFAFGSPFDFRFSMSSGVVSGKGRSVGVIRNQFGMRAGYENFIQVDAAINPGNSGGPLTNHRGEVIGMNTAIATAPRSTNEEGQFSGVGLAIPLDMIEPVVNQLITTGVVEKGFLGINVADRTMLVGEAYVTRGYRGRGIVITRIDPNRPELIERFEHGDVLVSVDGASVSSFEQAIELAHEAAHQLRDGDQDAITLTVWRFDAEADAGRHRQISLPVALIPDLSTLRTVRPDEPISRMLEQMGFYNQGVLVSRADRDGPAFDAGVRVGDVVTHVNETPVMQLTQLQSVITSLMPNDIATLEVWRYDGERQLGDTIQIDVPLARLDQVRMTGRIDPQRNRDAIESLGIARMRTFTESYAEEVNLRFHPGVLVEELVPGSPLARQIRRGAIIVSVMETPVSDVDEFLAILSSVNLHGTRNGVRIAVIKPDGSHATARLRIQ